MPLDAPILRYADTRYAVQRRVGFPWLLFAADLEQEYRDSYIELYATRLRLAHFIGIVATLGFIAMDSWSGLELLPRNALVLIATVTLPSLVGPILATYSSHRGVVMQRLVFGSGLVLGLSLTAVVEMSRAANPWFPYEALLLLIMYVYLISGLLFFQAATVGLSVWLAFLVAELVWLDGSRPSLLYESYYLFIANLLGLIGLYALQHDARLSFLMQNELRQEAMLDALTGLFNRREFRRHLDSVWLQAQREHATLGLLMVDVDDFKGINDTHGHLGGDAVLRFVGEVLRSIAMRPLDAVGRYGGDEFLAVWYGVDQAWFAKLAENLPNRIQNSTVLGLESRVRISISGGAVLVQPGPGLAPHDAIHLADRKLYEMKRTDCGTIAFTVLKTPMP